MILARALNAASGNRPAVVLANELLDNLPFGLAERRDGAWGEVRVHKSRVVLSLVGVFFAVLAMTSFFLKSERLKYVTLIAAVGYLGVYKSQLLSIVNIFGVMGNNLPIFKYNLGWYTFAVFSVVTTVLFGLSVNEIVPIYDDRE